MGYFLFFLSAVELLSSWLGGNNLLGRCIDEDIKLGGSILDVTRWINVIGDLEIWRSNIETKRTAWKDDCRLTQGRVID